MLNYCFCQVSHLAGCLAAIGVTKGDKVLIYMPLIPEAVIAMLATVRIGAVHSVVFGGFAARELCTRIVHAEPKVIIAASCGVEPNKVVHYKDILNEAIEFSSYKPLKCVIYQRRNVEVANLDVDMDISWDEALKMAGPHKCVSVEANDPLYILYTSGTTGKWHLPPLTLLLIKKSFRSAQRYSTTGRRTYCSVKLDHVCNIRHGT